jgi:hypothetical protein
MKIGLLHPHGASGILAAACTSIKTSQLYVLNNTTGISYSVVSLIVAVMMEHWIITLIVTCLSHPRDLPLRLS